MLLLDAGRVGWYQCRGAMVLSVRLEAEEGESKNEDERVICYWRPKKEKKGTGGSSRCRRQRRGENVVHPSLCFISVSPSFLPPCLLLIAFSGSPFPGPHLVQLFTLLDFRCCC
ncbi:hypothetical protein PIB30_056203 [Stylosanthes scabra]|uniref:Uncharacterized protein n=1 Tax=Stylosanthes scabra TaxID=79078 RepID=A0ABU6YGP9_9FABA|nr:hypothetical protein [Stylosanthes scabra]